jgi:hypothetical protein
VAVASALFAVALSAGAAPLAEPGGAIDGDWTGVLLPVQPEKQVDGLCWAAALSSMLKYFGHYPRYGQCSIVDALVPSANCCVPECMSPVLGTGQAEDCIDAASERCFGGMTTHAPADYESLLEYYLCDDEDCAETLNRPLSQEEAWEELFERRRPFIFGVVWDKDGDGLYGAADDPNDGSHVVVAVGIKRLRDDDAGIVHYKLIVANTLCGGSYWTLRYAAARESFQLSFDQFGHKWTSTYRLKPHVDIEPDAAVHLRRTVIRGTNYCGMAGGYRFRNDGYVVE